MKEKSIRDRGLYIKLLLAVLFLFVVPIMLSFYLIVVMKSNESLSFYSGYVRMIFLWMFASGIFGFLIIRNAVFSLLSLVRNVKNVSEVNVRKQLEAKQHDELHDMAVAFNRITAQMENKVKELEYSRKLARELFQKIGHAIVSSEKIGSLLMLINQSTKKVFEAEASFIVLEDDLSKDLILKAYSGPKRTLEIGTKLPGSSEIIKAVMGTLKPVIIKKVEEKKSPADPSIAEEPIVYGNILCVPILEKSEAIGALAVCDVKNTEKIDSDDMFLLESIANQVATAISNFKLTKDIEATYYQTLVTLAKAVEAKDPYSAGHLDRVKTYCVRMAEKLNLDDKAKKTIEGAALLHDLGKLGIPDHILRKKGAYTKEEFEIMKHHVIIGEDILKPLISMSSLSDIVRHHHEAYDGSGYPDKLHAEEIPLLARILSVADIYDALRTERPYKKGFTREEAVQELHRCEHNKLDSKLVKVFLKILEEMDREEWT